jgi:uncharacterized protein YmfQ (DUF2313 family)
MKNATMLYRHPGLYEIHGDRFDYIIVDADEEGAIDQALADGWHLTTDEAKGVVSEVDPETTRDELEAKAKELGITPQSNMKDATIAKKIKEALAGKGE